MRSTEKMASRIRRNGCCAVCRVAALPEDGVACTPTPRQRGRWDGSCSRSGAHGVTSCQCLSKTRSTPRLNQPADDGKFRFVATAFTCGKTYFVNDNEFENAHAQGQWCLLSLNVSNVQNEAQQFSASDQYLYDDSGKQFSADTSGTSAANPSSSSCNYEQLNPGVSISCMVAFDVPQNAVVTYAMLHDSSFSDGVKVALQ